MATVSMPQMGESVAEGQILKWLKSEGDAVEADDPLVEVSTDKVDTEIPSPITGKLTKILAAEGETVEVGTAICEIAEEGEASDSDSSAKPEAPVAKAETPPADTSPAEAPAVPVEAETTDDTDADDDAETASQPKKSAVSKPKSRTDASGPPKGRPPEAQAAGSLSPLVRRLAREHGVDLASIQPSADGGRITKADVLAAAEAQSGGGGTATEPDRAPRQAGVAPPEAASGGQTTEIVALSHIRKRIAQHMVASLQTSARAWNAVEVDMENIERLRTEVNKSFKQTEGFSLTYLPFICRAVVDALVAVPVVNASVNEELTEATYHNYVNLGIAVATDYGLIVPVVKGAEGLNVIGLARAIRDLADRARKKNLSPDEAGGSTFTITNPGPFGSVLSVPVINQPNVAILATEAVQKRVVVTDDNAIAIRHRMFFSMSWDHRLLDGVDAMNFLARLKENLETWDFSREVGLT